MDGQWKEVSDWAIRRGMVVFKDEQGKRLGEKDVDDIIRSHVEEEAMNDELEWNR